MPVRPCIRKGQSQESLADDPVEHFLELWGKLTLGWDLDKNTFLLKLNNIPHEELMKDEEAPDEPQLIMNNSKIWLNNERMEMIDGHWSRKQFKRQYNKKLKDRPTEDVWLEFFRCSSSETFH